MPSFIRRLVFVSFKIYFTFLLCPSVVVDVVAKIQYNTKCTADRMIVEVYKPDHKSDVYLENMKHYPELGCQPVYREPNLALFNLSLTDFYLCGTMRIVNQLNGLQSFHQRIVVAGTNDVDDRLYINVKCTLTDSKATRITRRDILPAGFSEEDVEITTTIQNNAPEPILKAVVKQGNKLIDGELNVKPGTPLTMEIYLDNESAPVYGLLVSYMRVSDTKSPEETIIFNGCSIDPYLFENFNTVDGDNLSAKFKAFKFPDTTYVQFTGTVNVCLDKCEGVHCSNGQTGYGRKKREINAIPYEPRKLFEVTLTTYVRMNFKGDSSKEAHVLADI